MNKNPAISIIIVNHLTSDILADCLHAIDASNTDIALEVIIVNNPSGQTLPDTNTIQFPVRVVDTDERLGFGAACNFGAKLAGGDYLLFLNPDVVPAPDSISALYDWARSNPGDFVTGRLTGRDGEFQPSCRRFPTIGNILFSRGSFLGRLIKNTGGHYTYPDYASPETVDSAAAALLLVPRECFEALGGFDETFFMYMEDTDLCYRHFLHGGRTWYLPGADAVHGWGQSTGRYRFRRILWHHISVWKYFVKHYRSPGGILFVMVLLTANCCLSLLVELFNFRP